MKKDIIIRVENLGKKYQLGGNGPYLALRDSMMNLLKWPYRRLIGKKEPNKTRFWALKNVSFEVKRGEVLGIIGKNGAGKTTLLKILSRITEPTTGKVALRGKTASLLEIGTGFHPELTGRENIHLNGSILGMKRREIDRKFKKIVEFSGIEKFIDTPVKRYSSGMYVRLAFSVAAHLEPEILLIDEVLAVGDLEFQKKCLGKMRDITTEGRTVLFVSHNMPSVEALCQRTLLLESGLLVDMGDARSVVKRYISAAIKTSQEKLAAGTTKNIRSVTIKNSSGKKTNKFFAGDDIIFEIELFHPTLLNNPRVSIGVCSPNRERLVTIHTDIHQNNRWDFQGEKRIRAVWKNNRMAPCRYRVDVSFWGHSSEIEYLPGCQTIEILPGDVYGTGLLPDANGQGYLLPDAYWEMDLDH